MSADESPATVHGRLMEAVHVTGYTFARALGELKWLLTDDRWRGLGGHDDVRAFVGSLKLDEIAKDVEQRREIAALLVKAGASQRATAKALDVTDTTIRRDLGKLDATKSRTDAMARPEETSSAATKSRTDSGMDAAKAAERAANRPAEAAARRHERLTTLEEAARGNTPLATAVRYPVLYADPPWRYEHVKTESRAIENQYPTMDLDAIRALPLGDVTTGDAVLFLWATSPKLAEALTVLEAWGFTYRTSMVWVKNQIGMGYYARQRHELLLIATKGEPPTPAPENRPDSVVTAPRGPHSEKPDAFYDLIERMYPTLPRLELFARTPRPGWARWGNEAA